MNSMDYFLNCPTNSSLQQALEAYSDYLRTSAKENCLNPCQVSLVRPKTFFTMPFTWKYCQPSKYPVVLRMPKLIHLTESAFSYPFMTFAAELGGNTLRDQI